MNEVLQDIETLESAIINLTEGASDEKRMAIDTLEHLMEQKKAVFSAFEAQVYEDGYACSQVA